MEWILENWSRYLCIQWKSVGWIEKRKCTSQLLKNGNTKESFLKNTFNGECRFYESLFGRCVLPAIAEWLLYVVGRKQYLLFVTKEVFEDKLFVCQIKDRCWSTVNPLQALLAPKLYEKVLNIYWEFCSVSQNEIEISSTWVPTFHLK